MDPMDDDSEPQTGSLDSEIIRWAPHAKTCDFAGAGEAGCHAHVLVDSDGKPLATTAPSGYGPSDLRAAYNVTSTGSSATTIAIVDAYGYSNAENDLATYRAQFGLPACTTANGCFKKVNQNGVQGSYPQDNVGWEQETALDLDMASSMCPNCKILLVQASSASLQNLATAENTAASLGAHVISNSYGGGESGSTSYEAAYNHPGVAITVSSGDNGYGVEFPASSPHVTAVGGTSLSKASNARGWNETTWNGAGSGCSTTFAKPSWQTDSGCSKRTVADVSAIADPNTGVAVYGPARRNKSAWMVFGGTSVAAPLVGGVYAANGGSVNYGSDPYAHTGSLNDVTSGSNGSCGGTYLCTAGAGYDGPTGLGTPNGTTAF
jgi:subtilase family serine protease